MNTKLIKAIIDDLFTNGQGKRADRLVLTDKDGQGLGGWADFSAAARIKKIVNESERRAKRTPARKKGKAK